MRRINIPKPIQTDLEKVSFVHLQFTDLLGHAKSMAIPVNRMEEALERGIPFDGSAVLGFVRVQESDMLLKPDPETWLLLEGGGSKYARIICGVSNPDGSPFEGCPRHCLAKVQTRLTDSGHPPMVGAEIEFFLLARNSAKPAPIDKAYYFDMQADDPGEKVRRDLAGLLAAGGIKVLASHHENSPGQQELCLGHSLPVTLADNISTFRLMARQVAHKHGYHASFMPKPLYGVNGSGMHIHISLTDNPEATSAFMAGVLNFAPEFTAVTNPLVNSYKRLVPGFEAPVAAVWSHCNRSPLIRIPGHGDYRFELRSPDPACNPYLALAVILEAGLAGLEQKLSLPPSFDENVYLMSPGEIQALGHEPLPTGLNQALDLMEKSTLVQRALGEHIYRNYLHAKRLEWDFYRKQIHQWEFDQYLDKY